MRKFIALGTIVLIALVACSPTGDSTSVSEADAARTSQAQTREAEDAAAGDSSQMQTQTAMAVVLPPTPTFTLTASKEVMGTATTNLNCREGPHANFEIIQIVLKDSPFLVIGKNTDTNLWLQIELEDGTTCWGVGDMIALSGSPDGVPEVASPPIPEAFYSAWVGTWSAWQNQCTGTGFAGCENTFFVTFVMTDAKTVVGSYSTEGCNYTDIMVLSADGMRVDGQEIGNCGGSTSLNFEVHLVMDPNLNQFRGRWNVVGNTSIDGFFCGARNGFGRPVPERP